MTNVRLWKDSVRMNCFLRICLAKPSLGADQLDDRLPSFGFERAFQLYSITEFNNEVPIAPERTKGISEGISDSIYAHARRGGEF